MGVGYRMNSTVAGLLRCNFGPVKSDCICAYPMVRDTFLLRMRSSNGGLRDCHIVSPSASRRCIPFHLASCTKTCITGLQGRYSSVLSNVREDYFSSHIFRRRRDVLLYECVGSGCNSSPRCPFRSRGTVFHGPGANG